MSVRLCQGALQRIGQEHGSVDHAVCLEQSVDGAPTTDGSAGMSAPAMRASARQQLQRAAKPGSYTQKIGANALQLSSGEFLTLKSRCGGGCAEFFKAGGAANENSSRPCEWVVVHSSGVSKYGWGRLAGQV